MAPLAPLVALNGCSTEIQALETINTQTSLRRRSSRAGLFSLPAPLSRTEWATIVPHKKVEALYHARTDATEALDALGTIHEVRAQVRLMYGRLGILTM